MNNHILDTSKWKEFKLSEWFEIGTGATCQTKDLIAGKTPRISVKGINNGIQGYFEDIDSKDYRINENFISFSFLGTCFYHPYKASLDMKVHSLKPKNYTLNIFSGLFLVNIFKVSFKGIFADQISSSDLKQESIKLPMNSNGDIDWQFMESYIKQSQAKLEKLLKTYRALLNRGGGNPFSLSFACALDKECKNFIQGAIMEIAHNLLNGLQCEWGKFKLTDLFTYTRGARLTKADRIFGDYPLVTAGEYNKGVKEYISNKNQKVFSNAITIDMFCNSFVHIEPFCCDDNVLVLESKIKLDRASLLFISTIINKDKNQWGYEKQYRQNSLEKHIILLPKDSNGNPNFSLMESFIKNIEKNHVQKLITYYNALKVGGGVFNYANYLNFKETNSIQWREFRIGDLFKIKPTKAYKMTNSTLFQSKGKIPVVTNSSLNNGVSGYVDLEPTEKGNMITYSDNNFRRNFLPT